MEGQNEVNKREEEKQMMKARRGKMQMLEIKRYLKLFSSTSDMNQSLTNEPFEIELSLFDTKDMIGNITLVSLHANISFASSIVSKPSNPI